MSSLQNINMKNLFVIGLLFLFIGQLLFSVPTEKVNLLEPVDIIHWILLFGFVLVIPYSLKFSNGAFHKIGSVLTLIGIVTGIGMCVVDFILWSLRDTIEERNQLVRHLVNEPSIWHVFITVGPAFFFVGLAAQASGFYKENVFGAASAVIGSILVGIGHLVFPQFRIIFITGYLIFIIGLIVLALKKGNEQVRTISN